MLTAITRRARNYIRNPRFDPQSGVPTNMQAQNTTTGGTVTFSAFGTESGLPYVDIVIGGTVTVAGSIGINFETTTGIAAVLGQTVAFSLYLYASAGSFAGITTVQLDPRENDSGGTVLTTHLVTISPGTTGPLGVATRFSTAPVMTNASCAFVRPRLLLTIPTGSPVLTMRVGGAMLDYGSTVPPVVPLPPSGAPGVSRSWY